MITEGRTRDLSAAPDPGFKHKSCTLLPTYTDAKVLSIFLPSAPRPQGKLCGLFFAFLCSGESIAALT